MTDHATRSAKSYAVPAFILWAAGVVAFIVLYRIGEAVYPGSLRVLEYILYGSFVAFPLLIASIVLAAASSMVDRPPTLATVTIVLSAFSLPPAGLMLVAYVVAEISNWVR